MHNLSYYRTRILSKLPNEISDSISKIESLNFSPNELIAAFDLDGTLIDGDIGEATFCYLKSIGHEFELKWKDYLDLLESGNSLSAFTQIITTMKGLSVKVVANASRRLLTSNSNMIHFSEDGVEYDYPIPKIIHNMYNLIVYLKISGWKIAVISASNHISVRAICDEFFKLDPSYVRGIRTELDVSDNNENLFTDFIKGNVSYGLGKYDILCEMFGSDTKPLITAGDSKGDLYLLNNTHLSGFAIVNCKFESQFQNLLSEVNKQVKIVTQIL